MAGEGGRDGTGGDRHRGRLIVVGSLEGVSRLALLLTVSGALLLTASPAGAATLVDTSTATVHKVSGSGAKTVYAGNMRSSALGRGTVRQTVILGKGLKVTGSYVVTYRGGTLRGTVRAKAKISGGKITFSGSARVTGGTGKFRGASGSSNYTGTANLSGTSATFTQRGRITY
jgi:hypothetical protein